MAYQLLLLILFIQLTPDAQRSKRLTTRHRLCLCGDRALRIQYTNDKESSFVSCDQRCADENNKGASWTGSRLYLRTRRELSEEQQACYHKTRSDPRLIIKDVHVTFLDRINSSSWYVRVSWNPFTDSSQRWKGYCLSYGPPGSPLVTSSFVSKNLTSVNISARWEERKVYLSVYVLPNFANSTQNEQDIFLYPYRRRRPGTTLHPDVPRFTLKSTTTKDVPRFTLKFTTTKVCHRRTKIDPRLIIKDVNVTFHDRINSSSWYAKVTWNPLTDSSQRWKGYCLSYFPPGSSLVTSSFISKNLASVNISASWEERKIYLSVYVLPNFANSTQNEQDIFLYPYRRRRPGTTLHPDVPRFTLKFSATKASSKITTYMSSSLGILGGLGLVIGLLAYFLRQKKQNIPLPSDFDYHAFIIFSKEDKQWLNNKLLPFLEEKHHLTCCLHFRDFVLGKPFRDNMADSVSKSYKVIALFSRNSVNSNHFHYEMDLAIGRLVEKRDRSLVVIRIDNVDAELLPTELKRRSFVDYYDILERPFWKQRLLKFLDLPEVSRTLSTNEDQSCDHDYPGLKNENRAKVKFNRFESTISNDSVISYLLA